MPRPDEAPDDPPEEAVPDPIDGHEPPVLSAREAARRGMAGWPEPGDEFPPPPTAVPPGRGGDQIIPRPLNARAGRPAPWAHLPAERRRPSLADVRAALAEAGPAIPSERELVPEIDRASAVLAPLYEDDGELFVILTRRTWTMRSHSGEVSFPGGRQDDADADLWHTALREAREEIALDATEVERDRRARPPLHGHQPLVHRSLRGRPRRRARTRRPARRRCRRCCTCRWPSCSTRPSSGRRRWTFPWAEDRPIFFFELVGDTVWGATGAMLRQLLGLVTGTVTRGQLDHV